MGGGKSRSRASRAAASLLSKAIAHRLEIQQGDPVMRTSYRFIADGEPVLLATSFEPLALTRGTPIENLEGGSTPRGVPRMDTIGVHITHVGEDVTGRAARPCEAETLVVPSDCRFWSLSAPTTSVTIRWETADIVVWSERYVLSYRLPIPGRGLSPDGSSR
ncbi:UTRA domain-containing protein [Kribbella rubisoli]|uniref:UTRA domain-containing protein n=1 Tax=Kribbella rubisoli TaxID=3075929 RepID=UPI003BAFA629